MNLNSQSKPNRLLTIEQVAALVGFSKSWVWERVKNGQFPAPRIRGHRSTRWADCDVEMFMAGEWGPLMKSAQVA
ncbi:MAG: AlpA family phage regulatory protein [Magnetococcales bacterium]|nr:AlpA family phage regulatory protein [Magnetococcales bacterium]NGZ06606.1 AlpA family phage regulatory protein [Magnetococcales bacterium]